MLDSLSIVRLYTNVLFRDMSQYGIVEESVRIGIESMREVYKADNAKQSANRSTVADFNDVAHRCAYLHKYAALHTAMVRDMMQEAVNQNYNFFHKLLFSEECFKICSLGGGPGSDVIGVLAALHSVYSYFPVSVSVVDYMENWCYSFHSILKELGSGMYGAFGNNTSHLLQWRYVGANLLKALTPDVELAVSTASLVTMIKFVSAASCKDTEFMVKNIFNAMKPGAVLFFIDNDGGGFRELIMKTAHKYNFLSIFGPRLHENYVNEIVRVRRFGSVSCHKTTVSVHILQKPVKYGPYVSIPGLHYSPYAGHSRRRVLIDSPHANASQESFNNSSAGVYTPLPQDSYSRSETLNYNRFYSPYESTPLTPCVYQLHPNVPVPDMNNSNCERPKRRRLPIMSPDTPRAPNRSHRMGGCIPLPRVKHWRTHLASRLNTFKSRVNSALKGKRKKKRKSKGKS